MQTGRPSKQMTELNTTACETYYSYSSNAQQANKSTERVPDDKQCMSQTAAPNTEQRTPPPATNWRWLSVASNASWTKSRNHGRHHCCNFPHQSSPRLPMAKDPDA